MYSTHRKIEAIRTHHWVQTAERMVSLTIMDRELFFKSFIASQIIIIVTCQLVTAGRDHRGAPALCEDRVQAAAGVRGVQGGGGAPVGHVAAQGHGHPGEDAHLQHRARPGHQVCPDHWPGEEHDEAWENLPLHCGNLGRHHRKYR